jgi:hypothetical protein
MGLTTNCCGHVCVGASLSLFGPSLRVPTQADHKSLADSPSKGATPPKTTWLKNKDPRPLL